MILCGKQLPNLATTQSKLGTFCMYVFNRNSTNSSSSLPFNFSKQETVNVIRHRIALDPSHKLQVDAISIKIYILLKIYYNVHGKKSCQVLWLHDL